MLYLHLGILFALDLRYKYTNVMCFLTGISVTLGYLSVLHKEDTTQGYAVHILDIDIPSCRETINKLM